jgi:glycosyltransferase involved in cell wall biosynthesis
MKIGFIIFTALDSLKGDAVHVRNLLKELQKSDLHVEALVGRPTRDRFSWKQLNFLAKMAGRTAFLLKVLTLRRKFDLFYLRDYLFAYLLSLFRVPYAFEINGLLPYEGLIRHYYQPGSWACRLFRRIERRVLRSAVKLISVSTRIRDYCVREVGIDPRKIVVADNAADTDVFHPDAPRRSLPGHSGGTLIGWMGSFESQHGFNDFLGIAARFRTRGCRDVRFLIIGGGRAQEQLQQRLEQLGLQDYFLFCGHVPWDQIPGYMLHADLCLSLYNRTPENLEYRAKTGIAQIKIFEYLALGKPVLSHDHADAREFFEERQIGWVCGMTPEEVADRILAILQDPAEIRQRARNALTLSREQYRWSLTAAKIVHFLKERE